MRSKNRPLKFDWNTPGDFSSKRSFFIYLLLFLVMRVAASLVEERLRRHDFVQGAIFIAVHSILERTKRYKSLYTLVKATFYSYIKKHFV